MHLRKPLLAVCLLALTGSASSTGLPMPGVEYSADREMETDRGALNGKVFHAGGKERSELEIGDMKMVTITRPDKQLVWTLMPDQQVYQELDFATAQRHGPIAAPSDAKLTEVGPESTGGHKTTKYEIVIKDNSGGGFVWLTKDNVPIKMDMFSQQNGEKTRVKMTLSNLRIGKQDPSLFEVPAGYTKMPSMGGTAPSR